MWSISIEIKKANTKRVSNAFQILHHSEQNMYRCADVIVSYEITNNYYSNARNCSDLRFCQSGRIAFDWFAIVGFCCCCGFFLFFQIAINTMETKKKLSENGMFPCKIKIIYSYHVNQTTNKWILLVFYINISKYISG